MSAKRDDPLGRDGIEELLPWYAAGTLDPADTRRVEEALAGDPNLARHYDLVREEMAASIHLNETMGAPTTHALADLFARIDREPERREVPARAAVARVTEFFARPSPRILVWSAGAVALALLLQAGVIGSLMLNGPSARVYRIASAPEGSNEEGAFALLRFTPGASVAEATAFLERNKISIVSGPSPGGLYRIRVAANRLSAPELGTLIDRLREDGAVNFIAPSE